MPPKATVALYSGLIVAGDAVSSSLRAKLAALRMAKLRGLELDVLAFCQHSDVDDSAIRVVPRVSELRATPEFRRASLHIFEFGIYYQLFNVVHTLRREQMAAVYHNITPRDLIDDPVVQAAIERSMIQKHLLARMSHVACDSEFNRQDLLEFGIPAERLSVLPLPVTIEDGSPLPPRELRSPSEPVRFLFVGRLVRAKGVLDLLTATRSLVDAGETGFELCLIGRRDSSDSLTTETIAQALHDSPIAGNLRFKPNATSQELSASYRRADVFVLPTYHEGYCVPILEAFGAGCPVIAYDNTNIPMATDGLAQLVATGDVSALAQAMQRAVENLRGARQGGAPRQVETSDGPIPEPEWRDRAKQRVSGLRAAHDDGFIDLVHRLLETRPLVPA